MLEGNASSSIQELQICLIEGCLSFVFLFRCGNFVVNFVLKCLFICHENPTKNFIQSSFVLNLFSK